MQRTAAQLRSRRTAFTQLAVAATALAAGPLLSQPARAHVDKPHAKKGPVVKEQKDWGIAGDAKNARRTVEVSMGDNMRFTPDRIEVRHGETVKFLVRNRGKLMHEFVIGTGAENAKHAELMVKHPNMEHDEPYMVHVAPGRTGEIIWNFNRAGDFEFACLIAGHHSAGMVGKVKVVAST